MNAFVRTAIGIGAAFAAAPLSAASGGSATFLLAATIAPFCRVQQASGAVELNNGDAEFGPVTETCNTAYRVVASFQNLDHGTVITGQGSEAIADDGTVAFVRPTARSISQNWALRDAIKHDAASPVVVQVSVTPL